MTAISETAIENQRQRRNARHAERYATDPLYREMCKQRQARRKEKRAQYMRERYGIDIVFRKKQDKRRIGQRKARRIVINDNKPFVGCDGEGVGRGPSSRYVLFRMGDRELGPFPGDMFRDRMLTTPELLQFISNAPAGPIYVGFAFEYDISNILRHVPHIRRDNKASRLDRLMRRDAQSVAGVANGYRNIGHWTWLDFDGYPTFGVNYLPRNHLSVCLGETGSDGITRCMKGSARTIYDVFGNFQSSFVNALEKWDFGFRHRETIERMKRQRDSFTTITQEIRDYCKLECELLAELMTDFRAVCIDADLRPKTWNGAGKLAAALHDQMGTIKNKELRKLLPAWINPHDGKAGAFQKIAHAAYYGGRFEVTRIGQLGKVWEHDIGSAYPAQMLKLPCLEHGQWIKCRGGHLARLSDDVIYVAPVKFAHPSNQFLCGLPIRDKQGSLSWPRNGNGIYWSCEIRSAIRLGATVEHRAGWRYVRQCDCRMFGDVERLYKIRQQIGKGRKGIPIKLAINSLYGKLAQRVGNPVYANPVWAGLITALTRAQLNDAIRQAPDNVVMIATDAVYTIRKPLRLKFGAGLGQWKKEAYPSLFIVQPGLYWPPKDNSAARRVKSRGVSASVFEKFTHDFETAWADYLKALQDKKQNFGALVPMPAVTITLPMFTGIRLAYHRNKFDTACQWNDVPRNISFDWTGKRGGLTVDRKAGVLASLGGGPLLQSCVYTEQGLTNAFEQSQWWSRLELEAMPEGGSEFGPPEWD